MVHRLHNRNTGYSNNFTGMPATNHAAIKATEGATALNLNNVVEENTNIKQEPKSKKTEKLSNDSSFENISIENTTYLQNLGNVSDEIESEPNYEIPTFEVDSIELANPELFSNDLENNSLNQENEHKKKPKIFENSNFENENKIKEPEMFEESNLEEDFEIPAFLRRQKN